MQDLQDVLNNIIKYAVDGKNISGIEYADYSFFAQVESKARSMQDRIRFQEPAATKE